jgi:hypothetical protein
MITLTLATALTAVSQSAGTDVKVRLDSASAFGTHTNVWFLCNVTVLNGTRSTLTSTNLFVLSPGLALRIAGLDGKELKRTYAAPLHIWKFAFPPHDQRTFKLMYGVPGIAGGYQNPGISLPDDAKTVTVQIQGTLSGSSYTNQIASNPVELDIP